MFVVFNTRALLIALLSVGAGIAAGANMTWGRNSGDRGLITAGAVMFVVDSVMRFAASRSLNAADHPKVLRRKDRASEPRPLPRVHTLFSADYGGQLCWICPIWLPGALIAAIVLIQQMTPRRSM